MPSSMTHTYFGMDVLKTLPRAYQKKIDSQVEYFKLFCQGSDPFMFYHFLLGKKAKEMGEIQKKMHHEKTQQFFERTITYIHQQKLVDTTEVMAYLYGYICHYYLDLYTHPFIFYKSGVFHSEDKTTYPYNGIHQEIEYMIDIYLIDTREKEKHQKFRVYEKIFQADKFSEPLKGLINESIGNVYSISNVVSKYERSIWYMKKFFQYVNYDPTGFKLKVYQMIDKITPARTIRLQELSYHCDYSDKLHYLNLEHKAWCYPWDQSQIFHTSFLDLYQQALKEAVATIKQVTDLLKKDSLDLKKIKQLFPDLSFATGKPCRDNLNFQYFEF